jgi:hypothetical protein
VAQTYSELWDYAKELGVVEKSEHPLKKEELIQRIEKAEEADKEVVVEEPESVPNEKKVDDAPNALRYVGRTNPVALPGLGRFRRDKTYYQHNFRPDVWERLCLRSYFESVEMEEL